MAILFRLFKYENLSYFRKNNPADGPSFGEDYMAGNNGFSTTQLINDKMVTNDAISPDNHDLHFQQPSTALLSYFATKFSYEYQQTTDFFNNINILWY